MLPFDLTSPGVMGPLVLLAKATLILVAAFGAAFLLQRAAAGTRHLVWAVSLGAILVVPAVAAWSPVQLAILPLLATSATTPSITPVQAPPFAPASEVLTAPTERTEGDPANPGVRSPVESIQLQGTRVQERSPWRLAMALWAVVAAALVTWLVNGFLAVRRIVRRGTPLDDRSWTIPLYEIADRLGVERTPRIVQSDVTRMPFAAGILHPTIVLPADCATWDAERRSAVLMHELAHIRRRDLLGHTLGRIACALYWFHPLVWSAARRLRIESERACDDLALTSGLRATNYAEHLLDIVSSIRHNLTPAAAIPMADRKEFEGRMLAILDPDVRRRPGRALSAALVGTLAALVIVVGGAVPANAGLASADQSRAEMARPGGDSSEGSSGRNQLLVVGGDTAQRSQRTTVRDSQRHEATDTRRTTSRLESPVAPVDPEAPADAEDDVDTDFDQVIAALASRGSSEALRALAGMRGGQQGHYQQGQQVQQADDRPALLMRVLRSDTSAALRRVAAWGLEQFAGRDTVARALADALRRDSSAEVRETAAWALSDSDGRGESLAALIEALRRDADAEVRATAAWTLGSLEADAASEALEAALSDASATVRTRAMWALGNLGQGAAPARVTESLRDSEPRVRYMAAWVLYQREDAKSVPALERALADEKDKSLRAAYIRALGAIGAESAPALARLLDSSDPEIRAVVVNALAGRGNGPWPMPMPRPRPSP